MLLSYLWVYILTFLIIYLALDISVREYRSHSLYFITLAKIRNFFQMFLKTFCIVISFLTVSAHARLRDDVPNLRGNYYMPIPGNGNQYVFNIDWSYSLDEYVVTVTGQPLAWATATLSIVNDTSINLLSDNGISISGVISYSTDLPTICWPTFKDFTCWKHLLSNITRIHVINM